MFRQRVVGHYVGRGYRTENDAVLTGDSGSQHKVDLVARDDLGRIALWWGDQDAFEGPELLAVKRAAKDIGAAPAIAVPSPLATLRISAREHGVIIIDEELLDKTPHPNPAREKELIAEAVVGGAPPPWPEASRSQRKQASEHDSEGWRQPAGHQSNWPEPKTSTPSAASPTTDAGRRAFDWLPVKEPPKAVAAEPNYTEAPLMPAYWGPVLYTAIALLVGLIIASFLL